MPDSALTITRVFDAPRELVFTAWTDPDHLASRLGPSGFTGCAVTLDTRERDGWTSSFADLAGSFPTRREETR
ncbi:SRPBCC domain-containing protein [Amycolatopsis sp. cmx-8-4]|uniref:SRPBCC domain-containing protein n=1 Tax=Amycolatopsis sp. cmx-8-4 TaxID=2790947 RepID=UPI00397CCE44